MEGSNPLLLSRDQGSSSSNLSMNNNSSKLPESPRLPMEFLSRSWSLPALQLSKALSQSLPSLLSKTVGSCTTSSNPNPITILEEENGTHNHIQHSVMFPGEPSDDHSRKLISGNSFSFASSATSQLVLDRIMSQSEVSPMTSGRPSCSEAPNGVMVGQSFSSSSITPEMFDSPTSDPLSPPMDFDKFVSSNIPQPLLPPIRVGPRPGGSATPVGGTGGGSSVGSKTVGRWLKERREKKKEESRVHNAQLHAAVSVAAVAAAVAATASATAAAAQTGKDEQAEQTDMAIATAATLVAARCVEAAEAMGAEREHLASVISSAVNVQSHGDIMTLTAAAATALRGAATLKARTMKEVCNIAAVLPVERGLATGQGSKAENGHCRNGSHNADAAAASQAENFLGLCNEELLARGCELLKRTRTGELHWKLVSVYLDKTGQVILKMKSRHVAGTITKKKKKILMEVCKDMPKWAERRTVEAEGEERRYFGLKTVTHRVIQFECKNQQEYDMWIQGVSRLLSIANEQRKNGTFARSDVYWN